MLGASELMRDNVKDFVGLVASALPLPEPIYEFGALQVPGQIGFADLRPLFPGKAYVGCDMRAGPGVDRILDLHSIDLPESSVGTVLCLDTLEHVERPRRALEELHRVLQPNGVLLISSVMCFPIHDYPHDYWRFTPEAFRSILKPFSFSFVGYQGKDDFPHTVVGVGFKGDCPSLKPLEEGYERWHKIKPSPRLMSRVVASVTPPILLPILRAVYRAVVPAPKISA